VLVHIAGLAADEGFIHLDFTAELAAGTGIRKSRHVSVVSKSEWPSLNDAAHPYFSVMEFGWMPVEASPWEEPSLVQDSPGVG